MSPITTRHLRVSRTARYHLLGSPSPEVRELMVVLHGYGHLGRDFLELFSCLAGPERLIVAPEGLSRFYLRGPTGRIGASWMTREDRVGEIADCLGYLDEVRAAVTADLDDALTVHVFGFSQGGASAFRWATAGRHPVDRLTLCSSEVPPDVDLDLHRERLDTARLTLIFGSRDERLDEERIAEEEARLDRHQVRHATLRYEGGHLLTGPNVEDLASRW